MDHDDDDLDEKETCEGVIFFPWSACIEAGI